ncbi:MAG: hypothetical protein QOG62_753 [Thermoleophilaceae bacterium]|nr:hypothetical protein [Thermoleophilaceae bacterium]
MDKLLTPAPRLTPTRGPKDGAELLRGLFADQLRNYPDWYLEDRARESDIRRLLDVFERYRPYLPSRGRFLDWGCHHAPDACLIRNALGDEPELYGCDFAQPGLFPAFHGYAGMEYTQLDAAYRMPYDDAAFDVVVGAGVVEHTANDSESLKELHRVITDGGLLVMTFVPNRRSYTEFLGRHLKSGRAHRRPYGRAEIHRLLLHHGFIPEAIGYHQMIPRQPEALTAHLWSLNAALERTRPVSWLSSNLMVIARRALTI